MKKHIHLISVALLVATALICTSCGGLASPKHETGSFSFRVTDEMISAISRAAVSDSTTCTITLHLYSTDGTSYDSTQTKTDSLAALKNYTFDPFTGIPLGMEMNLTVEFKAGGKLVYASDKQKFTLEKSNANLALTVQMKRIIDMPIVLVDKSVGDTPDYYRLSEISQTDGYLTLPEREDDVLNCGAFYCTDNEGTLYIANLNEMNAIPLEGETVNCTFNTEGFDHSIIQGLSYDASRDKVVTILLDNVTGAVYCYQFTPGTLPEELTLTPTTPGVLKLEKNPYYDNMGEEKPPVIYSFNGRLYSLLTSDSSAAASVKLLVQPLTDGSLIKDATVTIPDVHSQAEESDYIFNDIYVDESGIYVLFHQYEMWCETGWCDYNDETVTPPSAATYGFVDRGGIIVLDKETLNTKTVIGTPAVRESINLPFKVNTYPEYISVYTDSSLTHVMETSIPVTWAVADAGSSFLSNPQKIVAIKPKKLIIADSGSFLYSNDDWFIHEGKKYAKGSTLGKQTETSPRLIEIDLESFAIREVARLNSESGLYSYTPSSGFQITYTTQMATSVYTPVIDNTACVFDGGSHYQIDYTNSSSYSNATLKAGVQLGS